MAFNPADPIMAYTDSADGAVTRIYGDPKLGKTATPSGVYRIEHPLSVIDFIVTAFARGHTNLLVDSLFITDTTSVASNCKHIIIADTTLFPKGITYITCKRSEPDNLVLGSHELILILPSAPLPSPLPCPGSALSPDKSDKLIEFARNNFKVMTQSRTVSLFDYAHPARLTVATFRTTPPRPDTTHTCCVIS